MLSKTSYVVTVFLSLVRLGLPGVWMKINGLRIENLLSFDKLELDNFSPEINLIVGSNNSGKTNIIRTLRLVKKVIEYETRGIDFITLLHDTSKTYFKVEIDVELDEDDIEVLGSFIKAYVGTDFRSPPWKSILRSNRVISRAIQADEVLKEYFLEELAHVFLKALRRYTITVELVDPEYPPLITLKVKIRNANVIIEDNVIYLNKSSTPHDIFYYIYVFQKNKLAKIFAPFFMENKRITIKDIDLDLNEVIEKCLEKGAIKAPSVIYDSLDKTEFKYELIRMLRNYGIRFERNTQLTLTRLLSQLFSKRLMFLDEIRSKPRKKYSIDVLERIKHYKVYTGNGEDLPLSLLSYVSSSDPNDIRRLEELQNEFKDLLYNVEGCDRFRLSFDIKKEKDKAEKYLEVNIFVRSRGKYIPLEYMGSGVFEALNILLTLIGNTNSIILIDEPEAHLHPSLQFKILNLLRKYASKYHNQLIVITHSPYMVSPHLLHSTWRFYVDDSVSKIVNVGYVLLDLGFERKFLKKHELRSALFAKKAIIGCFHEILLVRYLLEDIIDNVEVITVIAEGDNEIPSIAKVLETLKISYCVFSDAKAKELLKKHELDARTVFYDFDDLKSLFCSLKKFSKNKSVSELIEKVCKSKDTEALYRLVTSYKNIIIAMSPISNIVESLREKIENSLRI